MKINEKIGGEAVEDTSIINRCPKENTYEYRLKMRALMEDMKKE